MKILKEAGLVLIGAAVAAIIIFGYWHNQRIVKLENITKNLEYTTNQIVQFINQPRQEVKNGSETVQ